MASVGALFWCLLAPMSPNQDSFNEQLLSRCFSCDYHRQWIQQIVYTGLQFLILFGKGHLCALHQTNTENGYWIFR